MTDPDATSQAGTSSAPIWIALILAVFVAFPWWPYALLVTLPVGLLIGVALFVSSRSRANWRALRVRNQGLEARISELERDFAAFKSEMRAAAPREESAATPAKPIVQASPAVPATPAPIIEAARVPAPEAVAPTQRVQPRPSVDVATPSIGVQKIETPAPPSLLENGVAAVRNWLLGGNTVARVGLLVLFVGVAFLLRYVAEHTRVPIEVRLLGVALLALVFLVLGWRLRERRPGFAITLQGGAIGILYLTAFAALKLYALLPPLVAFVFMALLAVASGLLAILQNARALASLGAAGGFLAPILISTGEGRVALLFSYYLLLNCGVLGVAWFRAWRELNWIGFVATFSVSGLWAVRRYTPEDFLIGQGFLAGFWLLFLVVSLLYALRQVDRKRGMFDTTLVFTLPLAAFGIQTRFTQGLQLALASTVAAATYLAVSFWLLRRREAAFQLLTEACFALGVGFLTLAVPLAASAQWTAAAWALEGVALLWVGQRQNRLLPLVAGGLLHVLGAFALARALTHGDVSIAPQWSGFTVNLAVFALAAFVSSYLLGRSQVQTPVVQETLVKVRWAARAVGWMWVVLLIWQPLVFPWYVFVWCGLAIALIALERRIASAGVVTPEWTVGIALVVVAAFAAEARFPHDGAQMLRLLLRLALAATAVTASLLSLRAADQTRRYVAAALLTLGVVIWLIAALAEAVARVDAQLAIAQLALALIGVTSLALGKLGAQLRWQWPERLAWTFFAAHIVFAGYVVVQAIFAATLPGKHYGWLIWPVAWALFYWRLVAEERAVVRVPTPAVLHITGLWLLALMLGGEIALRVDRFAADGWFHAAWGGVFALALWLTVHDAARWPMRAAPHAYARIGVPGLAVFAGVWLLAAYVRSGGDPAPLPALPLVNPMDLAALAILGAAFRWHLSETDAEQKRVIRVAIAAAAFLVINVIALRAVHFTAGIGWSVVELGRSLIVQAVVSLLWTAIAMTLMLFAHRRRRRPVWLAGALLLAVVVAKLFLVDLSGQGTIERIVSFVGVGLLILLIGYLAPVPPATAVARAAETT